MILEATQTAAETLIGQYGIGGAVLVLGFWFGKQFLKLVERMVDAITAATKESVEAREAMDRSRRVHDDAIRRAGGTPPPHPTRVIQKESA